MSGLTSIKSTFRFTFTFFFSATFQREVAYFGALNITGNAVLYNTFTFRLPFWNQRSFLMKTYYNNPSYTVTILELQRNIPVQGFWILTSPTYILDVSSLKHKYGIVYSEYVDFLMQCQWMPEVPWNMPHPLHTIYSQIHTFSHAFSLFRGHLWLFMMMTQTKT